MVETSAYSSARAFREEVRALGKRVRGLDKGLKNEIKRRGRDEVSLPMARFVTRAGARSRWAPKLTSSVKAMGGQTPSIKLTSAQPVFSGGASTRDVVPGALWAHGGTSTTVITPRAGQAAYRRHTTVQFAGRGTDFVFEPIVGDNGRRLLEAWSGLIDDVLREAGLDA